MSIHGRNVQFVCISACHSERFGQMFAAAGVPHVICVDWRERVADSAAKELARTMYRNLLQGQTVRQAFEAAKVLAQTPFISDSFL
jgi:ketopantoate hydroxymethyltransferase